MLADSIEWRIQVRVFTNLWILYLNKTVLDGDSKKGSENLQNEIRIFDESLSKDKKKGKK